MILNNYLALFFSIYDGANQTSVFYFKFSAHAPNLAHRGVQN